MKLRPLLSAAWCALALTACLSTSAPPGLTLHVAPDGSAEGNGSRIRPYGSLEQARDRIRELRRGRGFPPGGLTVLVHGGRYAVTNTFTLGAEDTGFAGGPITWQAARGEPPVFSGGVRLRTFTPLADAALRDRLPESVRPHAVQCDLAAQGLTNLPPLELGGFGSGRGFRTHPAPELFFNGRALPRAGWPDAGFTHVAGVPTNGPATLEHGMRSSRAGRLTIAMPDRLARWAAESDLWLYGYWFWDWADSYEKVARVDAAAGEVILAPPLHTYGYRAGQPFRAVNALCELDQPGEWYLDAGRRLLVLYPPSDPHRAVIELSLFRGPLVKLEQLADVTLRGFVWELGAGDGLHVTDARQVTLDGCTVRRCGGDGVVVAGGASNTLRGCRVYSLGRGALKVDGGDRRTLTPGGHRVEDCVLHDLSRLDRTYTPGAWLGGVGHVFAHNEVYEVPSSALRVGGNDHLIAGNHIHHVVKESDDQGAVDMWGDPTFRGNRFLDNYFHDVGSAWNSGTEVKLGQAGIRLDDAISGVRIAGNRFERCGGGGAGFGAVQIHGGKDNLVESNLFIRCASAVSFSAWGAARWTNFVAGRLAQSDVDATLYPARYPALVNLLADANRNEVRDNVVYGDALFRRPPPALVQSGNQLITNSPPPAVRANDYGPR